GRGCLRRTSHSRVRFRSVIDRGIEPLYVAQVTSAVRIVQQGSHQVNQNQRFEVSRRQLLRYSGIGVAAVAGSSFLAACGGDDGGSGSGGSGGSQKTGGVLIHGATGGGSKDTIDPHQPVQAADIARVCNLYEPLLFWN